MLFALFVCVCLLALWVHYRALRYRVNTYFNYFSFIFPSNIRATILLLPSIMCARTYSTGKP